MSMPPTTLEQLQDNRELYEYLLRRVGKTHLRQRVGIETEHAADRFGQGRTFLNIENWKLVSQLIRLTLWVSRLSARGRANVEAFELRHNQLVLPHLPAAFDGFTLLQLSDLHLDVLDTFPERLAAFISDLEYDICVLTGDYRFLTHGCHNKAMAGLERVRKELKGDIYAILGNHDTIVMAQPIEALGIKLLLNEHRVLERAGEHLYLAGIDDPHYFALDNLDKAYQGIPDEAASLLLAHSPEVYRHAAYVGFDVALCGHTHGGQICLPGSIPVILNSSAPKYTGVGAWRFDMMQGYTSAGTGSSVVPARFNCPPEVTLHTLCAGDEPRPFSAVGA